MNASNRNLKYRPDIDGLRALAILPVVIYHTFPKYAPGGFVGVDVFFVISGFLISFIIFKGLLENNFSFADFYVHRINRIFPALILVASACYVMGWIALLPDEFKQLGKHMAAGMGFVQNFVLWKETGYFDIETELKPLMHLWSLSVEEQFYLLLPFILWFLWRSRFNVLISLVIIFIGSLFLNLKNIHDDAVQTFFFPQTRFWELMFGSVVAYFYVFNLWKPSFYRLLNSSIFDKLFFCKLQEEKNKKLILSSILSFAGLVLIFYAVLTYSHSMLYPGHRAIIPAMGAAFLIVAGPQAWVNRNLLSSPIFIWIGLISYPLYLWHWPLLSFARIVESGKPSIAIRIAAVLMSFFLAAITYYVIEKRFRNGCLKRMKAAALTLLAVVIGYVGFNAYSREGLSFRIKEIKEISLLFLDENAATTTRLENRQVCANYLGLNVIPIYCKITHGGNPNVAILGDSHAGALAFGLNDVFESQNNFNAPQFRLLNIGDNACPALQNVFAYVENGYKGSIEHCLFINDFALNYIEQNEYIKNVIFSSRGTIYLSGTGYNEGVDKWILEDAGQIKISESYKVWERGMRASLDRMMAAGKHVIFVLDNPEIGFDPRSCFNFRPFSISNNIKSPCAIPRVEFEVRNKAYREHIQKILSDYPAVTTFDSASWLCDDKLCWAAKNGKPLYFDDNHLSKEGARLLANELVKLLHE